MLCHIYPEKRENINILFVCFFSFSVPKIKTVLNEETNQMELQFEGRNKIHSSKCVQYEERGICRVSASTLNLTSFSSFTFSKIFYFES